MKAKEKISFPGIIDLARYIQDTPVSSLCDDISTSKSPSLKWDLHQGFDAAVDMASKGGAWPKGSEGMMDSHIEMAAIKEGRVDAEDYEVVGHTLDIDAYLNGQPDCFINEGDEDDARLPVITIGVQIGRQANVDSKSILLRGAAVLSVIDSLESQGHRVELTAMWSNENEGGIVDFRTCIKSAEQTWSPSAVAFALCHPSFSRRLMFRVAETFKSLRDFTGGYGRGCNGPSIDFDVWMPWQSLKYNSARHALFDIESSIKQQLKDKAAA